jgi:flagellin-like hook-associated protein FlgL
VGARLQHVDLAKQRLEDGVRTLQSLLSETQDTAITRVLIDLKAQEVAYQAAAAAASALHRASLLEYL